jgi:uncharacterized protein YecE (DUF72 family)
MSSCETCIASELKGRCSILFFIAVEVNSARHGRKVLTRIGPAGWAYKDWWGIVYPSKKRRGFHELTFLASYFDTLEINVSFYRPIAAKTATTWLDRIRQNQHFRFTAKLWRGFTHDRNATAADEKEFKDGLAPLLEAGRLGALLLQFPWSFRNTDENRTYVARLHAQFSDYPLVLEVRHASWSEPGTLDLLQQMDIGLCNIDQPLFRRSPSWTQLPKLVHEKQAPRRAIRLPLFRN